MNIAVPILKLVVNCLTCIYYNSIALSCLLFLAKCTKIFWLQRMDSNHRPQGYEPCQIPLLTLCVNLVGVQGFEPWTPWSQTTNDTISPYRDIYTSVKCTIICLRACYDSHILLQYARSHRIGLHRRMVIHLDSWAVG